MHLRIAPSYVNEEDMKHFHGTYKEVCDKHDPDYYKEFKAWSDRYFVIQHRNTEYWTRSPYPSMCRAHLRSRFGSRTS